MQPRRVLLSALLSAALALSIHGARAADQAPATSGDWIAPSFTFHTGETLPNVRLHYTTLGDPRNEAVLVLHGTGQSGAAMMSPTFAGILFGPGQPLDATKYFIIVPDALGAGHSAKPSDGLKAAFPHYNYGDMVLAQYRLITEGLGVKHLRLVIGNSMGGMHTWVWGVNYPGFADALVPMASQPTEMAARNWAMRRMLIESIRQDPAFNGGNYTVQPPSLRLANVFMGIGTSGGTLAWQALAPTRAKADAMVDQRLAAPPPSDANDFVDQWDASSDYNPEPKLGQITAAVLVINSADDERNPAETGLTARAVTRLKNGQILLIPASSETAGHGTTSFARFWAEPFRAFLANVPRQRS